MIDKPKYVGRTCVFSLSDKVSGKLYFDTNGYADHYNVLRLHLFNKSEGVIDKQTIRLVDVFGICPNGIGQISESDTQEHKNDESKLFLSSFFI